MTILTIKIPDTKASEIKSYLKAQGVVITKASPVVKKSTALKSLETALKQVKSYQNGEGKMYTLSDVLDGK
jgi:hypothetical protein